MEVGTVLRFFILALFILGGSIDPRRIQAQTDPPLGTEATSINKVSSEFSSFLGDDSTAVVTGLRNGTPFSLTTTETTQTSTTQTTPTTINPTTGKMGLGNVRITLDLAKIQLSQYNIDQPTSEQLSAVLLGGSITTGSGTSATTTEMQGILTMRSDGMGWGQIAQELGYKLGPIISGRQTIVAPTTEGGVVDTDGQTVSTEGGIVTGSGKAAGKSGIVTGSGKTSGKSGFVGTRSRGTIVTGSGRVIGNSGGITTGNSKGHGHGIVSGSGSSVGKGGGFTGGGHGRGKVK